MPDPVTAVSTAVASSVISSVLTNIATRVVNEPDFFGGINSIKFKLGAARSYLKNVSYLESYKVIEIERVAYCAEDAIEKILWLRQHQRRQASCVDFLPRYFQYLIESHITLCQLNGEFKRLQDRIPGLFESNSDASSTINQFEDQLSEDPRDTPYYNINPHEVIGLNSITQDILKELEGGSSNYQHLAVVSIWGMGGTGKSTLAKSVFDKAENFTVKIWITVSQKYDVLDLRKKIIENIIKIDDEALGKMTDKEVCERLYASLDKHRYLIVLDDIWETKSWDDIFFLKREPHDNINPPKSMFPDTNNASRIIATTRKLPVAKQPNIKTFVHEMESLGDEEGWKLLKEKALPSHVSISEPLKSNLEHHDFDTWIKMFEKDVNWKEAGEQINIFKILALSYDDLPNELKPMFLYMTTFPEDSVINLLI